MEVTDVKKPLLASHVNEQDEIPDLSLQNCPSIHQSNHSFITSSFIADRDDIPPIIDARVFFQQFWIESKKLWYLAGPAIFTSICQYSLGAITQVFAGHIGTLELAAFSIENSVIANFSYGIMLGMGSALETLCGQAHGAGQIEMLGVYMQRSWIILLTTAILLMVMYIFAGPILFLIGQTPEISRAAGQISIWMIPQLFAYALNFPIAKFLQAQSKLMARAWISAIALALHTLLSWLFMIKLRWGMAAGTVVLNFSWWFIVVAQLVYIFKGYCGKAWNGFSVRAFLNLWGFVRLSFASAVMSCLEVWYLMILVLFAGYMKNAEVQVDAFSICMNISGWVTRVGLGCNAAVSVRVSNELGAAHPRTAKFSVIVVVAFSFMMSLFTSIMLLVFSEQYPVLFSDNAQVQHLVTHLTGLLALCVIVNALQPALTGVAIGAGWQALVAFVNIACYYLYGIPVGIVLGFVLNWSIKGIWIGMLSGITLQTLVLLLIVYKTNWKKEASSATKRIKLWGGDDDKVRGDAEH